MDMKSLHMNPPYKVFTVVDTVMEEAQWCYSLKEALDTFAMHVIDSNEKDNKGFGQIVYIWESESNEFISAYDPYGIRMKKGR